MFNSQLADSFIINLFAKISLRKPESDTQLMEEVKSFGSGVGICGIIPLRPWLGERQQLRRGCKGRVRAARIDLIRANSRKGRGTLACYAQSPRSA